MNPCTTFHTLRCNTCQGPVVELSVCRLSMLPNPSLPVPSLPFPSLPFPSLPFPSSKRLPISRCMRASMVNRSHAAHLPQPKHPSK